MSEKDRVRLVEMARSRGFSDTQILKDILEGELGGNHRRELIVKWSAALGISASEALQLARSASLISSTHPPRAAVAGMPLQTNPESSDE
jgi:hypothetical protein